MVKIFIFLIALFSFFIPDDAFCWGPGIHAMISSSLLDISAFSKIVANFQAEFLWGSLMADMMIGKNLSNWKFHPHNWDFVFEIFEKANKDNLRAFMLGYMVHLSQDVVAHNFLIPEISLLYALVGNFEDKNILHIKIELMAENSVPVDIWTKIKEIQNKREIRVCSEFLEENLKPTIVSPKISSFVFRRSLKINAFKEFLKSKLKMNGKRESEYSIFIDEYIQLAYDSAKDFLRKFDKSKVVRADPTGIEAISVASSLVKSIKEIRKKKETLSPEKFFLALREFQPDIFGKRTPVLEILKTS